LAAVFTFGFSYIIYMQYFSAYRSMKPSRAEWRHYLMP
jgi:hypothetical protein